MSTQDVSDWLNFPITVFIDTQAFMQESYDFGVKGKLTYLRNRIDAGEVNLLISSIVRGEVVRHIKQDVEKGNERLQGAQENRHLAILRESKYSCLFKIVDTTSMIDEAITIFENFLTDTKAIMLNIHDIDLETVIADYFGGNPPFGEAHKKNEFPDAFNVSMLKHFSDKHGPVYVVSGDSDFSGIDNLYCFATLGELLDVINSQNEICMAAKNFIEEEVTCQGILEKVKEFISVNDYQLSVDGTDTDRKGLSSGYEYEEVELLSVSPVILSELEAININYNDNLVTVTADCKTRMEFSCSFFDEENSIWDPEDKEYAYACYGTMHESHIACISVEISVHFDKKDEDTKKINFEISDIDVDMNIDLDQYTLQKDGRKRTDNPYSDWEEDLEYVGKYCFSCGCELNGTNNAGNGLCKNCAQKHYS